MTAAGKLYLTVAALVVVIVGFFLFRAHERQVGALEERNAALLVENKNLAGVVAADSQRLARIDTVRVYRQVTRADTVLQRLIDSSIVHHHDTVTVTREVLVEAKATIDSTKLVADACCRLAQDYKRRWQVADSLYQNTKRLAPSPLAPHFGVGAAAGINPQGKLDAVAGLTLTWKIP